MYRRSARHRRIGQNDVLYRNGVVNDVDGVRDITNRYPHRVGAFYFVRDPVEIVLLPEILHNLSLVRKQHRELVVVYVPLWPLCTSATQRILLLTNCGLSTVGVRVI